MAVHVAFSTLQVEWVELANKEYTCACNYSHTLLEHVTVACTVKVETQTFPRMSEVVESI